MLFNPLILLIQNGKTAIVVAEESGKMDVSSFLKDYIEVRFFLVLRSFLNCVLHSNMIEEWEHTLTRKSSRGWYRRSEKAPSVGHWLGSPQQGLNSQAICIRYNVYLFCRPIKLPLTWHEIINAKRWSTYCMTGQATMERLEHRRQYILTTHKQWSINYISCFSR